MAQPTLPDPQGSEDILVLGRKLNSITVSITRDSGGRDHCSLSDTTGFADVDAAVCKATTKCVRSGAIDQAALGACAAAARPRLLKRYQAAVRRQTRTRGSI